jgi:DNA-binding transcriptional ArsR family regulator
MYKVVSKALNDYMEKDGLPHRDPLNNVLPYAEIKGFAPRQRDTYIQNVILRILELKPKGVTISDVAKFTGYSRPTVSKHLDVLVAIGESYKVPKGNLSIFYKNGKIVDEVDSNSISTPEKTYTFYVLQNDDGKFLYIQEKELDEFRAVKVRGGVTINMKDLPMVLKKIDELGKLGVKS